MAKMIKMFRPGRHVAKDGTVHVFTAADLEASAAAYDPELHAAPMVIGHPKFDDPKYGTIQRVAFAEGFFQGEPAKVDPEFAETVNSGRYDRVSTAWYHPASPSNPVPGVYYPRHLGFLGAAPPGCKGLGAVSFAEGEEMIVEFCDEDEAAKGKLLFGDYEDLLIVRTFRNLKNALIEMIGKDKADQVIDEYTLDTLQAEAMREETKSATCSCCGLPCAQCSCTSSPSTTEYGDHPSKGVVMTLTPAQIAAKEADLTQREERLKLQESGKKHGENVAFAEGLVQAGKLLAVNKAAVVAALDFAEGIVTGDTIEFGEGEAKKTQTPAEIIRGVLSSYPKLIEFGELGAGGDPVQKTEPIPGDIAKFV